MQHRDETELKVFFSRTGKGTEAHSEHENSSEEYQGRQHFSEL